MGVRIPGVAIGAFACALAAIAASPVAAAPIERVTDGSFSAATCNSSGCVSPGWTAATEGGATPIGPLCRAPAQGGPSDCQYPVGSGYDSPYNWAAIGDSRGYIGGTLDRYPPFNSSIRQNVVVPESTVSDPATLSFLLLIIPDNDFHNFSTATFTVDLEGVTLFSATDVTPGYATYHQVTVPVPATGPTSGQLRFEADSSDIDTSAGFPITDYPTDTFDVDDVSLTASDAPVVPPPDPTGTTAAGPTGQRAAALAKCNRKHGRARKKCRKKANLLPV